MADTPYDPPNTLVHDVAGALPGGNPLPEGRSVPAGNGWRWITSAWAFMSPQLGMFIGVSLLLIVIHMAMQFVPIVGSLAAALFQPVLLGGFLLGCEAVRRGGPLEFRHLFAGFDRHAGKLMGVGALSLAFGVVVLLVLAVALGSEVAWMLVSDAPPVLEPSITLAVKMLLLVLVIFCLSVVFAMACFFAPALIVVRDYDLGQAVKASFAASVKNILPFLVWTLAFVVLAILASIPLLLGWILLLPVVFVATYMAYRDVFHDA